MKNVMLPLLGWACISVAMPALANDTLPEFRPQVSAAVEFPSIKKATRPQGAFVSVRNIALVAPGMRKSEVYTLLDVPHFAEGLFGVRRWNYIFNFYTGQGNEYRQCQYQLQFDKHYRVDRAWWKETACADLFEQALSSPTPKIIPVTVPVEAAEAAATMEERPTKTYSFNFDFNKSEITADGERVITEAVQEATARKYRRVVVTGFTDTVGPTNYNDALAARRGAATVDALAGQLRKAGNPLAEHVFSRAGRDLAIRTDQGINEVRNRRVIIEFY